MKKTINCLLIIVAVSCLFLLNSCSTTAVIARNTVDVASLEEINLERKDYEIIETISVSATIIYNAKKRRSVGLNNEFVVRYKPTKGMNVLESGMLRFGYLSQDVISNTGVKKGPFSKAKYVAYIPEDPEILARRWATYKLIEEAKAKGADALIVPVRSTDIKSGGKKTSIIKTTVSAKAVRIYND